MNYLYPILLLVLFCSCSQTVKDSKSSPNIFKSNFNIFGVDLRLETPNSEIHNELKENTLRLGKILKEAIDPDCLYRKKTQSICVNNFPQITSKLEKMAEEIKKETKGFFEIRIKNKENTFKRDFAGLSQGFFLDELKKNSSKKWLGDFAGDIFFSGGFKTSRKLSIADPIFEAIDFAEVEMERGWMLASTSRNFGGKMRNPINNQKKWQEDFQRLILFAKPDFSGTRLDAWSTAIMAGGRELLINLWQLKKYRKQWAFLYFDKNGETHCSPNLICHFNKKARLVKFPIINSKKIYSITGNTMGTSYTIHFNNEKGVSTKESIAGLIKNKLININKIISHYLPNSELSKFNQKRELDWIKISKEFHYILKHAQKVSIQTKGAFDVTLGPMIDLWGFGPNENQTVPLKNKLEMARKLVGFNKLIIDPEFARIKKLIPDLRINLSAIGKGYAVDSISTLLKKMGIKTFVVEIGGEVKASSENNISWPVIIEEPSYIGSQERLQLNLQNMAVATSGSSKNYFVDKGKFYSHTFDYQTGSPINNKMVSVSVFDKESCMHADALATALMAMGLKGAKTFIKKHSLNAYIIHLPNKKLENQIERFNKLKEYKSAFFINKFQ